MSTKNKNLPNFLATGDVARLIPVGSSSNKENHATSVFLSTLTAVKEFSEVILGSIGINTGVRTEIKAFTEIVFADKSDAKKLDLMG